MLEKPERKENRVPRCLFAGGIVVFGTLGLTGNITLAEESNLLDTVEPMQAAHAMPSPFTESNTRVKVYTDTRGRVVREVDIHLVIVDDAPAYDPELASWSAEKSTVAAAAQQALDGAFEAASQGLAETFGDGADLDTLLTDPSDLFDIDDILSATTESGLALSSDDDGYTTLARDAIAVPEPGTAMLLALGFSAAALRRRRDVSASPIRPEPNRVDTAE